MTFENLTVAENFIDPDSNTFWAKGSKTHTKKTGWIHLKVWGIVPACSTAWKLHCHRCLSTSLAHCSPELHSHPGPSPQPLWRLSTLRASFIFSELLGPELLSWNRWFRAMSSRASSWLRGILRFPREHWCCSSLTCHTHRPLSAGQRQKMQEAQNPGVKNTSQPSPSQSCAISEAAGELLRETQHYNKRRHRAGHLITVMMRIKDGKSCPKDPLQEPWARCSSPHKFEH